MRILALCEYFDGYADKGSFRVRFLTAKKMAERGHFVTLVCPSDEQRNSVEQISNNLLVVKTPGLLSRRWRKGGFGLLDCLYKSIEACKFKYDVVHVTHGHRPSQLIPALLARTFRESVLVEEHWELYGKDGYTDIRKGFIGRIIACYDRWTEPRLARYFNHIVAISTALGKRFYSTVPTTVLYGGSETASLEDYDIAFARQAVGIPRNAFCIGISNLIRSDHSHNEPFLEALGLLCEDFEGLYLIASGDDIEYVEEVKRKYKLADRIVSPGYVAFELYNKYLSSCDLFVLPYPDTMINRCRWPNKIGDFLCLNRPILSNPTGDVKSLCEKYKVGFLCDASKEAFYQLLHDVLKSDIDLQSFCRDSVFVARELLSFDLRVDRLLGLFEDVIDAHIRALGNRASSAASHLKYDLTCCSFEEQKTAGASFDRIMEVRVAEGHHNFTGASKR